MTRDDIDGFIADQVEWRSAAGAAVRFRSLRQSRTYLTGEGERREDDPITGMSAPAAPEKPVPLLTDDRMRSLPATLHRLGGGR